ncbi:MAG: type I DNA topoisomerase [Candidatus Hydrogenedentes bacterium]|nr:type I DNA topoisomerase [Candidatus Hydrogenedentota bacterium]
MLKLVIVESPAKAKTISKFLGKDYDVVASYGHVRDLPSSADEVPESIKSKPWARMAVDVEHDFKPYYVVTKDSKKQMAELRRRVKGADEVVLATDEDREGESISWHLFEELKLKQKPSVKRIAFHEITKSAIKEAIDNPRDINEQLVRAQESRRILDRLFGYSLSPVLWKKVRTRLSAGRVQSVAVRLVVEREEERRAFRVSRYWDIEAQIQGQGKTFTAALVELGGKRLATGKDFDASTGGLKKEESVVWLQEDDARRVAGDLERHLPWRAARVEQKETRQRPWPPFITSSLQQAASAQLGFSPSRTMQIAQKLYEGIDLGHGEREGLITYMRTDSFTLSEQALREAEAFIKTTYGERYHERRQFTTKSKSAQEAHEAIRPTHLDRRPEAVQGHLKLDELKLYALIWKRTLASQMADAVLMRTTVDFRATSADGEAILRANGSVITFDGFMKVLGRDQTDNELPPIQERQQVGPGQALLLEKLAPVVHETKPPARYTEASLVRALEEDGIGRPSTYAPTIATIQQRDYVTKRGNALVPTFLGIAVTLLLRKHFGDYVAVTFTAQMEDDLDAIANGEKDWIHFLKAFYRGEGKSSIGLDQKIKKEEGLIDYPAIAIGEDPETGESIVVRLGRSVPFLQRGEGGDANTVSLPPDLTYEELTVEKARELLATGRKTNEPLGQHPDTGQNIYALQGPYGPYVQLGETGASKAKPKRASLPKEARLEDVDLASALKYLSLPRDLGVHPDSGKPIQANLGRFGPFVVCDGDFRSLQAGDDVYTVSLERALELLRQPKGRRAATKTLIRKVGDEPGTGKSIDLFEGRYGPYVTNGEVNASLPKNMPPDSLTMERAQELLAAAAEKKPARSGFRRASSARKAGAKPGARAKKRST